jgi:1-acyl-sn-glycerol-3-phosphate acyltransferase
MRAFKPGAFELALRNRLPILPIVITGTANALPKRGFVLRGKHPLRLSVLEPIPYEQLAGRDAADVAEHVRAVIGAELGEHAIEMPVAPQRLAAS